MVAVIWLIMLLVRLIRELGGHYRIMLYCVYRYRYMYSMYYMHSSFSLVCRIG